MKKIRVGVIGTASLTSGVLIKLLTQHKYVEIVLLVSQTQEGRKVDKVHKFLKGVIDNELTSYNPQQIVKNCDMVFLAKQHGECLEKTIELSRLAGERLKLVDLSADFRIKDPEVYKKWYNISHTASELLKQAVYGLPEVYRGEIKKANLVANPGCYPTSVILGIMPLLNEKLIEHKGIIIDALCGASGAGKKPNERNMFVDVEGNIIPYDIGTHRHIPEIEQELSKLSGKNVTICFSPHVAPFKSGMVTTIYTKLKKKTTYEKIKRIYEERYKKEPFVRLCEIKGEDGQHYPMIQNVVDSNFCDIGFLVDPRTNYCIVIVTLDNLLKGAAGQAIQNMNIMSGVEETEGLPYASFLKSSEEE